MNAAAAGQIAIFQQVAYPSCFFEYAVCDANMIQHVASYIQICGIIAGMLFWGYLGDYTGRKWGSRSVAAIMLSGVIMLTFTPFVNDSYGYFAFFMTAQTWRVCLFILPRLFHSVDSCSPPSTCDS